MYIVRVKGLFNYEYIYLIPMFLCAIISIRSFIWKSQIQFKILSVLLLLTLFIESFAIAWEWVLHKTSWWSFNQSNLWVYNGCLTIRHILTALFFQNIIKDTKWKRIIVLSIVPFFFFAIFNYFLLQTPFNVNSFTIILSNVILVFVSLLYFKQLLDDSKIIRLSKKSEVWITLGIFIYYTGTLPFFILFNKLISSNSSLLSSFLFINDTLNIIMYSLLLIGFLCLPQTQK